MSNLIHLANQRIKSPQFQEIEDAKLISCHIYHCSSFQDWHRNKQIHWLSAEMSTISGLIVPQMFPCLKRACHLVMSPRVSETSKYSLKKVRKIFLSEENITPCLAPCDEDALLLVSYREWGPYPERAWGCPLAQSWATLFRWLAARWFDCGERAKYINGIILFFR